MSNFIQHINTISVEAEMPHDESVFDFMMLQYKRIVFDSLVTSFGLDFIIKDQHGGDVDTVHNVREIGRDSQMRYKNRQNEQDYLERGDYDTSSYHGDSRFGDWGREAKERYNTTGEKIEDAYTGKKDLEPNRASRVGSECRAERDHVVECKPIHDDRGRVLAGLKGEDLANQSENLAWTNKSLNASMGKWAERKNARWRQEYGCDAPMDELDMVAYLREHPEIDSETRIRMLKQYQKSRKAYDARINRAYYSSSKFWRDSTKAAGLVAIKMGMRQALGLVMGEIWFAISDEISSCTSYGKEIFNRVAVGFKKGLQSAKQRFADIWKKFLSGAIAGAISSVITTLANVFFTTAKSLVKIIRQTWASLVEAFKILMFNPDCLPMGERILAAMKIIATGASVVVGVMVGELISKTPIGAIPIVGDIVQNFVSAMTTGVLTCTLLFLLDRSPLIKKAIVWLNKIPCIENQIAYFRKQAVMLDQYCAELMNIDLEKFKREIATLKNIANRICQCQSPQSLNFVLISSYKEFGWGLPWIDSCESFDNFMEASNAHLHFK